MAAFSIRSVLPLRGRVYYIGNSLDFVSYKDRKAVAAALKQIYRAKDAWDHATQARGAALACIGDIGKQARQEAALALEKSHYRDFLSRAEAFTRQLQRELAEAARCHAIAAGIIADLAAEASYDGAPKGN